MNHSFVFFINFCRLQLLFFKDLRHSNIFFLLIWKQLVFWTIWNTGCSCNLSNTYFWWLQYKTKRKRIPENELALMKLFVTYLGENKIYLLSFFSNPISSSLAALLSKKHFLFHHLKLEGTPRFTRDVTQKSCVLKMADAKAYLTLSDRQKGNKEWTRA